MIQDETGARLVGINPSFVRTVIFALSGALAGIVAITQSMSGPLTVNAGFELTTFALIVTVVGGLGSVAGAFLAGVLLGVVNSAERPLHRAVHHDDHPPRRRRPDDPHPAARAARTVSEAETRSRARRCGDRLGAPADRRHGGDPRGPPAGLVRRLAVHDVARRAGAGVRLVRRRLQPDLREHEPALPLRRRPGRGRWLRRGASSPTRPRCPWRRAWSWARRARRSSAGS